MMHNNNIIFLRDYQNGTRTLHRKGLSAKQHQNLIRLKRLTHVLHSGQANSAPTRPLSSQAQSVMVLFLVWILTFFLQLMIQAVNRKHGYASPIQDQNSPQQAQTLFNSFMTGFYKGMQLFNAQHDQSSRSIAYATGISYHNN